MRALRLACAYVSKHLYFSRNLDSQLKAYEAAKELERQTKEEEDRLYREEIQLQLEMDARRERERRADRVALARSNRQFNLSMRKQKDEEAKCVGAK